MPGEVRKKFIAIDGNSLLYRAFFAMRYLSTSSGQPTNALYGLTTMLLRLLEEKPDYIAAAFDTSTPTFRHVDFEDYKAHRKPTPDALLEQTVLARDLVRAFNIPVIEVPGFEADDVIGGLAKKAADQGVDTLIVTGDLDALQLVNDHVKVMTTVKGVSDTVIYDTDAVIKRFGLSPDHMIDYKGLKGDPSDNIPGVPGIGDKTAADLLKRFGTIENLLEHVSELPEGKIKKTLEENKEIALKSKWLATIITELPVDLAIEQYRSQEPDYDALRDLFVRLEFKTMLKRLPEVSKAEGKAKPEKRVGLGACRCIDSDEELKELIGSLERVGEFALQCHTADSKSIEAEIIGISFSSGINETAYVHVMDPAKSNNSLALMFDGPYQADMSQLKGILGSKSLAKYCHDSKLNHAALALRKVDLRNVTFDTMLAAYVLDPSRGSFEIGDVAFEALSLELPGVTAKKTETCGDNTTLICGEAEAIFRSKPILEERLKRDGLYNLFNDLELPLAPILAEMEMTGVAVDVSQLGAVSRTMEVELREVEEKIYEQAGEQFNIGSPKQLQTILYKKMGLASGKKTKTGYSTSAATLEELAADYPIVEDILRYRELTKIKSTYADALPRLINAKTGRIHTSLNQAVTATGRLSSSNPNLQNIPIRSELGREIRKAFVASGENTLLSADYSQIELRILAHYTGDEALVHAFQNDIDIHTATACTLFNTTNKEVTSEMRRRAKTINFAVIYGMADYTLSKTLGISVKEAKDYIETYFARFPGVRKYTDDTIKTAREQGYVSTLMGRRRYIQDIKNSNRNIRLFAERAAVNMPIQGTAADIMKVAMIHVHDSLKAANLSSKMVLQVHDELLLEVVPGELKAAADILCKGMESAFELNVPLRVDVKAGKNWAEMAGVG
ncbi:MAG: DNA polymerase I [Armatimonadetes bacterium]|nr:DNA polymerase I [Armatimonadota bacterium]